MAASPDAKRILIVDDDPLMRDLFSAVLKRLQFETVCAGSAAQAREKLAAPRPDAVLPDLILVDVQLGETDGLDFARELAADPIFERIPIVALSATTGRDTEERARRNGCAGFIGKPINPRTFGQQVKPYLALDRQPSRRATASEDFFAQMRRDFLNRAVREVAQFEARSDRELLADGALAHAAHRWAGASGMDGLPDVLALARSLEELATRREVGQLGRIRAELALVGERYQSVTEPRS